MKDTSRKYTTRGKKTKFKDLFLVGPHEYLILGNNFFFLLYFVYKIIGNEIKNNCNYI